ncbi:hypothetical protein ES319_D10G009000v1 [Gossypium barbadense]|uniref:Major facilitator superfamily (MFS) profile domain-containing protein n=2 Tax=Gossypium TaxID=3633 RepID=A0A5J5PL20_GOSBA|nr:hypothetical protein ES319_D10G009000v1 [Gossypium barbadense]TYG48383.1 hypothetical protein ES288_D10G009200v1 [Gossypium darwinii]
MVEGGISKPDKTEFTECWKTTWKTPYIMRLALSAGIGGLLFGYDTVISGALLYIREDFHEVDRKAWLQETIVSMAVAGAIIGAGFGGWINDRFGRKISIMVADVLFFVGAIVMALAPAPWMIILGRIFVGFGVGMASMTAPLYISEASPARIRGALVTGTWRWMLGVAGLPAVVQFVLMLSLPESPRWLYRKSKVDEAKSILERIYPAEELEDEMNALKISVEAEKADEHALGDSMAQKLKGAFKNVVVRRGLYAGVTVQVAQQFSGINTVMYYSPTIVQFAGFASNKTAMALSLITSGLNAVGSIVSMTFVDRYGRRRMMIISMIGIIACLVVLTIIFSQVATHSPNIDHFESMHFALNASCSSYVRANDPTSWNCMSCLRAECGFCANGVNKYTPGACLALRKDIKDSCREKHRTWYKDGCPSRFGFLAVVFLGLYIISYSPRMGTVPWIVNSEIYPLRYRGIGGGIAAVANWVSNLIVSQTFLTLTKALGSAGTFLLFAVFCGIGLIFIFWFVPETKGLQFEEVEKLLQAGFRPEAFRKSSEETKVDKGNGKAKAEAETDTETKPQPSS